MDNIFPPYETNPKQSEKRKMRPIPFRVLIPNLLTLCAVAAGMTALRYAVEGHYEKAIMLIFVAGFLDLVDGRIARLLKGTSKFGAQLDSLADFFNFGIVPAFVIYFWQLKNIHHFGWIVVIIFAACVALRLARFNVALDDAASPAYMANFFSGMPSPAGGIAVMLPLYLEQVGLTPTFLHPPFVAIYTLIIAILMISTIPVFSGKKMGGRVPRDKVILLFILALFIVSLFAFYTWAMMSLAIIAYLASIPYGMKIANKMKNEEARKNESVEPKPE